MLAAPEQVKGLMVGRHCRGWLTHKVTDMPEYSGTEQECAKRDGSHDDQHLRRAYSRDGE